MAYKNTKKAVVVEENLPILEYLGEFKALIDACGQYSLFCNSRDFVAAGVNKAKIIASSYSHDYAYFDEQSREWDVKAKRSYAVLKHHAEKFGYEMPEERSFLDDFVFSKDRREAYKGYLNTCLRKGKTLSPAELEAKFQARLRKRLERA